MSERLPPLTSLRAFEAAARHMSFAQAADELSVTPAALSYQIKSLETHLGAKLFRRLNRAVALTEIGERLANGVAPAFAMLQTSWRDACDYVDSPHLVVTAGPAFTAKWLAPRIYAFAEAHPEIDLRLTASLRLIDFERDGVDVAIRFGPEPDDPGLFFQQVAREWVTPMMHPALAARVKTPTDLRNVPILHQEDLARVEPNVTWRRWFEAAGLGPAPEAGARFSQADHAIDAAASGAGVVLGRISLAHNDLKSERLIAPFDLALTLNSSTRLVCPAGTEDKPAIRAFRAWVMAETAIDPIYERSRRYVAAVP
ncbi:MAG: transcriptional regulator GcvA [Pseudomonadota bacterium]